MGRWVYREGKKGPISGYFRSYFFCGLLFNFIGIFACMSVKYYDEEITKAQWKGLFSGLGFSTSGIAWTIIASSAIKNNALIIISLLIQVAGILFGIFYNYKGNGVSDLIKAPSSSSQISSKEMALWVEAYLRNIGLSSIAISAAVSDGKLSASYHLIRRKPSISKEDFLIEMEMYEFL